MMNLYPSCLKPGTSMISRKSWLSRPKPGNSVLILFVLSDVVVDRVKSEGVAMLNSERHSKHCITLSMRGRSSGSSEIHLQATSIIIASSLGATVSRQRFCTISCS